MDSSASEIPQELSAEPPPRMSEPGPAVEAEVRHFSCYCGTRLTIAVIAGSRRECLCGAVHELTPAGVRTL